MKIVRRNLAWVLLALALPARAVTLTEADFFADVPIVLSASRLSQPITHTPAAVTIIDQDMIRASGYQDIPDLFRLVPGFNVAYTRDNTWGVGYHGMADAYSRRMQVLIDGRSVYLPGFGQTPWAFLPLSIEDIDHIEVVRGPNAATYGANSFFGVINIITKDPSQVQGVHGSVQAGQQSNGGAMLRYGGGSGDFRYRLSLSDQRRDRFDTQTEKTITRLLDFRGDYRLSNTDTLNIDFAASRGDWRQGRVGVLQDPVRDDINVGSEHFQAKFKRVINPRTEWSLQFYHIRAHINDAYVVQDVDIDPRPTVETLVDIPVNLDQTQWRDDVEFQMIAGLNGATRLVWGAETRWEGTDAPGYFYGKDGRSGSMYRMFGNVEWMPTEHWVVNGGVMAEHHYYTGLDFSPRLAVNYLISPDHALRASISQAYRSPTFFEVEGDVRYFTTTGYYLAQRFKPVGDLQPEKILSREIGYVGHVRSLNLEVDTRLFNDRVTKLIGQETSGSGLLETFQSNNSNHANIRGADIQLKWQPQRDFDLILNYARVSIDSNEPDISESAPRNNFSVLAIYRLAHGWEASAAAYRVGYMKWLDDGDVTQAYTRIDARLARRWELQGHQLELSLVGQNLGGKRYEEFRNDNLFDGRAYVGLSFDW
jgi:iron complex outermembrane receptor protein